MAVSINHNTTAFKHFFRQGRIAIHGVQVPGAGLVLVLNLYGWTGGGHQPEGIR
jgi:hypothetical protein